MRLEQNPARKSEKVKRGIAWALITSLLNPAFMVPASLYSSTAQARDTDIYLAANYSGGVARPAVMFILDTSDSMNTPEPWREYDADHYDSHVEYLWNSPNYINTVSTADPSGGLPVAGSSGSTFVYGGNSNSPADARTMLGDSGWWVRKGYDQGVLTGTGLRDAALAYASGTRPGDPDPRKLYRHYAWSNSTDCGAECRWRGGGMFLYWVPLEGRAANDPAVENDARLRSDSFNKIWGTAAINQLGNTNPSTWPIKRGGIFFGYAQTGGNDPYVDYRSFNKCQTSLAQLEPSTVYAPSSQPQNAGKMLDQRWVRWGRYLGLDDSRASFGPDPKDLDLHDPNPSGFPGNHAGIAGYSGGYLAGLRDRNQWPHCDFNNPTLPVRTRIDTGDVGKVDPGDSYAGWANLAPDYGGYTFAWHRTSNEYGGDTCNSWSNSKSLLDNAIRIYYPNSATHPTGANLGEAAWYLKRYFPVPEYYDSPSTVSVASGGTPGTAVTKTRYCSAAGQTTVYDAKGNKRSWGGTCQPNGGSDDSCNDRVGSCQCSSSDPVACAAAADPAACSFDNTTEFYTRDNKDCGWDSGRKLLQATYSGCGWNGRASHYIESDGTYYYGGACTGSCTGELCPAPVNGGQNYCNESTNGTKTVGSLVFSKYRTDSITAGCSSKPAQTYWYGGNCVGSLRDVTSPYTSTPPAYSTNQAAACNESTSGTQNINGVDYFKVRTDNGTAGCSDRADTNSTCSGVLGSSCNTCSSRSISTTVGATSGTNSIYTVYNRAGTGDAMSYVDCKADDGTVGNPAGSYLRNSWSRPSDFGTDNNDNTAADNNNNAYSSQSSHAIPDANVPPINIYHPNYLNWKFGAKACRAADNSLITSAGSLGGATTCRPIGRKTRLQIAKDALVNLVKITDGVDFGLMVFNKLDTNLNTQGGNVAAGIKKMGATCDTTPTADCANRTALIKAINAMQATAQTPLTETMYEAYLYFAGQTPYFGTNTSLGVTASTSVARGGGTVTDGRDTSVIDASDRYITPVVSNPNPGSPAPCQKNYVVLISDGGPENDVSADTQIKRLTQTISGNTYATMQGTTSHQFEKAPGQPYSPIDSQSVGDYVWLDELTYFMANADMSPDVAGVQSVNTYTIGFAGGSTEVLENAAIEGKGNYQIAEDSAELKTALSTVFEKIRDWNPSAAAASVPVSAFNRAENADEVYLAFFGPTLTSSWGGTVKKYKIGLDATTCGDVPDPMNPTGPRVPLSFCLTGQKDYGAGLKNVIESDVNLVTREIESKVKNDAESFWINVPGGDGSSPQKGGSGEILRQASTLNPYTRKLYTIVAASATSQLLTDSGNELKETNAGITKTLLGNAAMSDAERATLINFARGGSPADANCNDADVTTLCTAWRAWPHHDVLHSTPSILTYDPDPDANAVTDDAIESMYYMSNDGMLHAINTKTGEERWTFMAEEALAKLSILRTNGIGEHLHAGDGSPVLYLYDGNHDGKITTGSTDKAYLYFGLRRGGKAYYALDVTDKDKPRFMWKITPNQICNSLPCNGAQTDYEELAETWSTPAVVHMQVADPVLVFGAGYNPVVNDQLQLALVHDGVKVTATANVPHEYATGDTVVITGANPAGYNGTYTIAVTGPNAFTYSKVGALLGPVSGDVRGVNTTATVGISGRGVFFTNAVDGTLIQSFTPRATAANNRQITGMAYSMPSDALPLNADLDIHGYVDRLYMGDMGGNIWRLDIGSATPSNWVVTRLADLSGTDTPKRKVFFPPAMVKHYAFGERFDGVYIGTGDRENPLGTATADRMFMIKDHNHGSINGLLSAACNTGAGYNDCPAVYGGSSTDFYDITDNAILTFSTSTIAEKTASVAATAALKSADGWVLRLEADKDNSGNVVPGEKAVNQPVVFEGVLRFGTYNPKGQTNSCTPPGVGHQYAFNALDGTFIDINQNKVITSADGRIAASFGGRGYDSKSKVLVMRDPVTGNRVVKVIRCLDGVCTAESAALSVSRAYWYQEPEQ